MFMDTGKGCKARNVFQRTLENATRVAMEPESLEYFAS